MVTVGLERLIEYRDRHGYNQQRLSRLLDIAAPDLSKILAGLRRPGLTKAARIEERTGIPARSWTELSRSKSKSPKRANAKTAAIA